MNTRFEFDELAKDLARGLSRREAMRRVGAGLAAGLFAELTGWLPGWRTPAAAAAHSGAACSSATVQQCVAGVLAQYQTQIAHCPGSAGSTAYQKCTAAAAQARDQRLAACQATSGCGSGLTCTNNVCCPSGQLGCRGTCIDPQTDNNNCGACGNACTGGKICGGSPPTCVCPNGPQASCPPASDASICCENGPNGEPGCCTVGPGTLPWRCGTEVPITLPAPFGTVMACCPPDFVYAGGCCCQPGTVCSPYGGGAACCPQDFPTLCSNTGDCVNTATDDKNCGGCSAPGSSPKGQDCTLTAQKCVDGQCVYSPGYKITFQSGVAPSNIADPVTLVDISFGAVIGLMSTPDNPIDALYPGFTAMDLSDLFIQACKNAGLMFQVATDGSVLVAVPQNTLIKWDFQNTDTSGCDFTCNSTPNPACFFACKYFP